VVLVRHRTQQHHNKENIMNTLENIKNAIQTGMDIINPIEIEIAGETEEFFDILQVSEMTFDGARVIWSESKMDTDVHRAIHEIADFQVFLADPVYIRVWK
jgi:D-alanine-D-alanine ligase-like ATP-grasp enzyme